MSRDVPDVVVFALVVAVTVSTVALPVSAIGQPTATATTAEPRSMAGGERMAQRTTANGTSTATQSESGANESIAPGQRLAGVVGVQGAEIDGELEERTLATRVSRAESNASKAAVVATEVNAASERLRDLRERQSELRTARQAGEIPPGEYRARMAVTAAQIRAVQTQIESSEQVTRDLPDEELQAHGVNREELDRLRQDADELTGPEVAEIARRIAGDNPGRELDPERGPDELPEPAQGDDEDEDEEETGDANENAGPPEDTENAGPPEDTENASPPEDTENAGPPEDAGGEGASNRSTSAGPPEESGNGDGKDDPGNSGEAGNGDGKDDPGNSGEAGNGDGKDDPGNSGEAGNGDGKDDQGNSGSSSDDAGNSDNGGSDNGNSDAGGSSSGGNSGGGDSGGGDSGGGDSGDNQGGGRR